MFVPVGTAFCSVARAKRMRNGFHQPLTNLFTYTLFKDVTYTIDDRYISAALTVKTSVNKWVKYQERYSRHRVTESLRQIRKRSLTRIGPELRSHVLSPYCLISHNRWRVRISNTRYVDPNFSVENN